MKYKVRKSKKQTNYWWTTAGQIQNTWFVIESLVSLYISPAISFSFVPVIWNDFKNAGKSKQVIPEKHLQKGFEQEFCPHPWEYCNK